MIISDEIHFLEWLIAQLLTRIASEISASILERHERLVHRLFRVFCIVDTMKQGDYVQKVRRRYHEADYLQKLRRQYHEADHLSKEIASLIP